MFQVIIVKHFFLNTLINNGSQELGISIRINQEIHQEIFINRLCWKVQSFDQSNYRKPYSDMIYEFEPSLTSTLNNNLIAFKNYLHDSR